jgi:hypothetical protein
MHGRVEKPGFGVVRRLRGHCSPHSPADIRPTGRYVVNSNSAPALLWAKNVSEIAAFGFDLVPGEGFEPPTFGLQNRCTTTVLTRPQRFVSGNGPRRQDVIQRHHQATRTIARSKIFPNCGVYDTSLIAPPKEQLTEHSHVAVVASAASRLVAPHRLNSHFAEKKSKHEHATQT